MSTPRSSTGAGLSKRRGQYSSRACNECRRRRCKCDGAQPVCATCAVNGRECEWSTESDARRPATKQLVESLRVKIQTLEAEIEHLKNHPSTTATATNRLCTPSRYPLELLNEEVPDAQRPQPPTSHITVASIYRCICQIDPATPVNQHSQDVQLSLVCDWSRYLPQIPGVSLSRLEHDTLLLRCFKYGTSWLLGLVPELFLHDMLYSLTTETPTPRLQHYTPFLHCSIMAFASAFSDDPLIRAPTTRAAFAVHAKQWMDEEFREPVMCLVSALGLLAGYHCGMGEKDAGYMYMGMSFRAVHIFVPPGSSELEDSNTPQTINENWHFWSAFSHDKLMATEYRRDYDISIPHSSVYFPSIDAEIDNQPWPLEPPIHSAPNTSSARLTTLAFHETCKLMVIAARIIDIVHHPPGQPPEEHTILNTHLRLDTWFTNLPENLNSNPPLPHIIVMHVCYWWLLIVLHQSRYGNDGAEKPPIADLSIRMCSRASRKIVRLLTVFENQYGLRFFPCNMMEAIYTCAVALLRELTCANEELTNAAAGVGTCISALRYMSTTWPSAQVREDDLQHRFAPFAFKGDRPIDVLTIEQENEDTANISKLFYRYMHDWGYAQGASSAQMEVE